MVQSKNIIVLCDGTANQVTVYSRTNILRLARRLLKTTDDSDRRQVVFYDPGLGTEGAPGALTAPGKAFTKFLGLVCGYGLSKNLADAYVFLMQHYEPGDRIYIFGFSRGAYTARALTGLLGRVGLLERGCDSLVTYAIKYFHDRNDHQLNFFKKMFSRTYPLFWQDVVPDIDKSPLKKKAKSRSRGVIPVHFLGVWDTVKSVGILRHQVTLPDTDWLPNMINGRHAVALDEKRSQYQPEIWEADTDSKSKHEEAATKTVERRLQTCLHVDVETKWFSGVHADVGGGYGLPARFERELIQTRKKLQEIDWGKLPDARKAGDKGEEGKLKIVKSNLEDRIKEIEAIEEKESALAYVSLKWMIEAARKHGLLFDEKTVTSDPQTAIPGAKPHNPLFPFWWLLGWKSRSIPTDAQDPSIRSNPD